VAGARRGERRSWISLVLALVLLAVWLAGGDAWRDPGRRSDAGGGVEAPAGPATTGAEELAAAAASRRSGFMVTARAPVERVLADDDEGDRHQRFVLSLGPELTVLGAHNIDLAPRVPLEVGDEVALRGQYECNPKGGVLHWTHHDPGGRREGGWNRHDGRRYE
jgi:hypothetical protein